MAKNVADLIDELQLRLRDTGVVALTDTIVMRFLSYGVGYAALARQQTITVQAFTSERHRQVYDLSAINERIVKVVRVATTATGDLHQTTVEGLSSERPTWFRDIGDHYQSFAQIGKRVLLLYPAIPRAEQVGLYCRMVPALYTNASSDTTSAIADDLVPLALTIAETLLLVRERRPDRLREQMKLIQQHLNVPDTMR
ncbi:MAG: hypothetical protein KC492_05155 [Myxococcales bacterium]|nr:hypothetical protein [Myxococcales bacterium]